MNKGISLIGLIIGIISILVIVGIGILGFYPYIFGNASFIDVDFKFEKAYIYAGDEIIELEVDKWNDYEGEQIQIKTKDGKTYLVSSFNTILVNE